MHYAWTLLLSSIFVAGCGKTNQLDQNWSAPIKFSQTDEGLGVSFYVYKWNDSLLALHAIGKANDEYDCSLLGQSGGIWERGMIKGFSGFNVTPIIIDPITNRLVFISSKHSDTNAVYFLRTISLDNDFHVNELANQEIVVTPKLSSGESVYGSVSGCASSHHLEYFVPYTIRLQSHLKDGADSPDVAYPIGLFYSPDGGFSWQRHEALTRRTWDSSVEALGNSLYFLGHGPNHSDEIWSSRQEIDHFSSTSETLAKNCVDGFMTVNNENTIHLCWLDSRHEQVPSQLSMFLFGSEGRKNYEVFYRHVIDSDDKWSREILISKTSRYAYSPTISAEGKNIVIAWAGTAKAAEKYHDDYSPNDIYYAVSKDNGETWSDPVRVTDNLPLDMTGGCPQVILLNNVVHLFYIEGKYQKNPSVSGLSLIKQPPYDIIYQQRPFPN